MNNDFFIQGYDNSQALGGFGQMFKSIAEIGKRRQEEELRQQEIKRMQDYRDAQSRAFGVDPQTGELLPGIQGMVPNKPQAMPMQSDQMPMQDQLMQPTETPEQANARMAQELKDHIIDPNAARDEKMALDEIGITPDKYSEVKQFVSDIKSAPDEEIRPLTVKRVENIADRGGDARDTASLLGMPPEKVREIVSAVGMIVDMNALRRMYALDPAATQRIIDSSIKKGGETDYTQRVRAWEKWKTMPEETKKQKEEKRTWGILNDFIPKGRTFEEALALAEGTEKIKTTEQKKRDEAQAAIDVGKAEKIEGIKTNAEIIRDQRKAEETPQGKADMAKKNAELIALRSAEEAKSYDSQDSLDLIDTLSASPLEKIYGQGESVYPELLRSQKGIDMISQRDRLVATITMARRGELKGQGAVSDSDQRLLANAATILGNPNVSPELAKSELARVKEIITRTMQSAKATGEQLNITQPSKTATPSPQGKTESIEQRLARLRGQR